MRQTERSRLEAMAVRTGRPADEVVRHHVLEGLLRRLARSPRAGDLVLRGALRTRMLVAPIPRPTRDADFLALFPRDLYEAMDCLTEVLAVSPPDDGVVWDPGSLVVEEIWQETGFPGLRAWARAGLEEAGEPVQIDLGFSDPLEPPAVWIDYPALLGDPVRVQTCRAETLTGWKLHGLFEHGLRRWRPKDLHDLLLLTSHASLDPSALADAIRVAFTSRDEPLAGLAVLDDAAWWSRPAARAKWAHFVAAAPTPDVPSDLRAVVACLADALRPAIARARQALP